MTRHCAARRSGSRGAVYARAGKRRIPESGASGVKDMGKVMALLKSRLAGKADMGKVSGLVKARLSG